MNECRMIELLHMSHDLVKMLKKNKVTLSEINFVLKMAKEKVEEELLRPIRRR